MSFYKIFPVKCPYCDSSLPIWNATGNVSVTETGESAYDYSCSRCGAIIQYGICIDSNSIKTTELSQMEVDSDIDTVSISGRDCSSYQEESVNPIQPEIPAEPANPVIPVEPAKPAILAEPGKTVTPEIPNNDFVIRREEGANKTNIRPQPVGEEQSDAKVRNDAAPKSSNTSDSPSEQKKSKGKIVAIVLGIIAILLIFLLIGALVLSFIFKFVKEQKLTRNSEPYREEIEELFEEEPEMKKFVEEINESFDDTQSETDFAVESDDNSIMPDKDFGGKKVVQLRGSVGVPGYESQAYREFRIDDAMPDETVDTYLRSSEDAEYPVYVWKDRDKVLHLYTEADVILVENASSMFAFFEKCEKIDLSKFDFSMCTRMDSMFYGCYSLKSIDLSGFDTSNVEAMSQMFEGCCALESIDVSSFDTSNVRTLWRMFAFCSSLKSVDVNNFNTSRVTNMGGMFLGDKSLTKLDLSNFDTLNVENMDYMFDTCSSLTELDISGFNTTPLVSTLCMFKGTDSLKTIYICNMYTIPGNGYNGLYGNEDPKIKEFVRK